MKRNEMLAYAAGIVDGDGCINIMRIRYHRTNSRSIGYELRVMVTNTKKELLDWLETQFGGSVRLHHGEETTSPNYKVCWRWSLPAKKAERFLMEISPFLLIKRPQVELALVFQKPKKAGKPLTDADASLQEAQFLLMKSFNKRGRD